MTAIDTAFVDRVTAEARDIKFWRTMLTWVAGLLYGIGWVIGKTFTVLWLAVTWTYAAAKVGFQDARSRDPKASG